MIATRSSEPVEYIFSEDPALDTTHPDFSIDEYFKTFDRKHMPIRPGAEPTVFTLGKLTKRQFESVLRKPEAEQLAEAVRYALKGVTNFRDGGPNGPPVTLKFKRSDLGEVLDQEVLEKIFVPQLFAELKTVIIMLSGLHPTSGSV